MVLLDERIKGEKSFSLLIDVIHVRGGDLSIAATMDFVCHLFVSLTAENIPNSDNDPKNSQNYADNLVGRHLALPPYVYLENLS